MISKRWITIALVSERNIFYRGWGGRRVIEVAWRGRKDRAEPYAFFAWHDLFGAVYRRLLRARLRPLAIASDAQSDRRYGQVTLLVQVERRNSADFAAHG